MNFTEGRPVLGAIQFLTDSLAGRKYPLDKDTITIGSDDSNDIVISSPSITFKHARITRQKQEWSIEKISPWALLTVNQQDVEEAVITNNDVIGLGPEITFRFTLDDEEEQEGLQRFRLNTDPETPQYTPTLPLSLALIQRQSNDPITEPVGSENRQVVLVTEANTPLLEISSNIHSEKQTYHLTRKTINIGRDASNDIVINEPFVSQFHMQIIQENGDCILRHPHPSKKKTVNGLLYQGQYIKGEEGFRKKLMHGDIIRIGDEHGTVVTLAYNDGKTLSQDELPEVHPIPLNSPEITIGRLPDSTVVLDHPQVFGHHARLVQEQGTYRIIDIGNTNHVYVNAERVTTKLLEIGDEIRIGPFKLTYSGHQLTQYDESHNIRIDALHLRRFGNKNSILLNDITLSIPPRSFIAVVGGSGAGKSTLLEALNGLRPAQEGVVLYNGQDYYRSFAAFSTQLGYVPQDDIVHRELTVERALYYAARLRLPNDFTKDQIWQRINEVLEDVEMSHRRKMLIYKLSGGQRKRVSIAMELLGNPSVFFLDEPTSGLDPGLDRKMMFLLRKLADKGHTIVLATHATNNINICDYVCFLAQGGHLVFFGPPDEAKAYFDKSDFAEIYSTLEPNNQQPDIAKQAELRYRSSTEFQKHVVEVMGQGLAHRSVPPASSKKLNQSKRGNPWKQFLLLTSRYLELLKNDPGNLAILLLQAPIIGLILLLLVTYEIDTGVFDTKNITQCPTTASIVSTRGYIDVPTPLNPVTSKSCDRVKDFLHDETLGQEYAKHHGGEKKALQDFIQPGLGGDAQKVLFITMFAAIMFGCINAAREIVKESSIYRRERTVNLGIAPYLLSKIFVLGGLCLLQSGLLVWLVNLVDPFHDGVIMPAIWEVYITVGLTSLVSLMIGLTVSAIVPNNDWAMSFIPLLLLPQVIFSGTIFPLKDWFSQAFATLIVGRWAMIAAGSSVGLHSDKLGGDKLFGNVYTYHGLLYSIYDKKEAVTHLLTSWSVLLGMFIMLACITGFFMKRKDIRV